MWVYRVSGGFGFGLSWGSDIPKHLFQVVRPHSELGGFWLGLGVKEGRKLVKSILVLRVYGLALRVQVVFIYGFFGSPKGPKVP